MFPRVLRILPCIYHVRIAYSPLTRPSHPFSHVTVPLLAFTGLPSTI